MTAVKVPDPYASWSRDQLVAHARQLTRALMSWQLMAANMASAPGALDKLSPTDRALVENMTNAYSD